MKKTVKVISILLTILMMVSFLSTTVMAAEGIIDKMKPDYSADGGIATIGQKITNIISTVGVVISVIVLLILGIKYMMGSASEKAEYKKTMIPYLVGAVLIFGASAIAKVVVNMAQTITTT